MKKATTFVCVILVVAGFTALAQPPHKQGVSRLWSFGFRSLKARWLL